MELGLSPRDFVLDGDPALPSPKRDRTPSPIFGPFVLWPNGCMHQDATWYGRRPQPRVLCITPCLKKTSHLCLAITLTHMNGFWYIFGRNVTDKVGNQKTLYYAASNNLCFCTTYQNAETRKSHFSLNWIVLHTQCTCALSSWKKLPYVMCLIAPNICWDSKIFH